MNRKQLEKVKNDYNFELSVMEYDLFQHKSRVRAIKTRIKLIKRKLFILDTKIKESENEEINFSCTDFDNLDILG